MTHEPLVVQSTRIERRRPGLGERLMRLGLGGFFLLPAVGLSVSEAFKATQMPMLPLLGGLFMVAILAGTAVCPFIGIGGFVASAVSFPSAYPGVVKADDAGLVLVRGTLETSIAKERIEGGIVLPGSPPLVPRPKVEVYLRGGDVLLIEVPDGISAHRLLGRLGIDPERRRVAVPLAAPSRQFFTGCASMPLVLVFWCVVLGLLLSVYPNAKWAGPATVWGMAFSLLVILRLSRTDEVIVGNDGLRIRGKLWDRWIPFSSVQFIAESNEVLFLDVARPAGGTRRIEVARGKREIVMALAGRIRVAMALGSNGQGGTTVGAQIDPKGKTFAQWKEGLRALVADGGYRQRALSPEALLSLLEDPDASPGHRLGAAMALRIAEHPEARARIHVAADACADEGMRRALEEAAEGELAERTVARVVG
jgi:hypothetical protein